jgi:hypothetical protein
MLGRDRSRVKAAAITRALEGDHIILQDTKGMGVKLVHRGCFLARYV